MAKLITLIKLLPKTHQILLSLLLLAILVVLMLPIAPPPSDKPSAKRISSADTPEFDLPLAM
ncbi:MAG: OapA N-terminal domain-containing protein, partial [Shewanella sp.]